MVVRLVRRFYLRPRGAALACIQLANIARRREEYATPRALLAESLTFYQDQNDPVGIGMALLQLGQVAEDEGDNPSAQLFYGQGLAYRREQERGGAKRRDSEERVPGECSEAG